MEGCGIPPKRAGKRWAIVLALVEQEYCMLDSLCVKGEKKKNYRATLPPPFNGP